MSHPVQVRALDVVLARARQLLVERIADLEARVRGGDETTWPEYLATVDCLTRVLGHASPGQRGELLTTAQMAERLNIRPKSLLRRKARGDVRPALQRGKLIRWCGDEAAPRG